MTKEEIEDKKEQIALFFKNNISIHIALTNDRFYNGSILEVKEDFFIFEDFKIGKLPIFYIQIKQLEAYREKEK